MNLIRFPPSPRINVENKLNTLQCCIVTHCRSWTQIPHNLHPFQHWFRGKGGFRGQYQFSPIYFGEDCLHFGIVGNRYLLMSVYKHSLNDCPGFQFIGNDRIKGGVYSITFFTSQLICCTHWWRHQWRHISHFFHKKGIHGPF